MSSILTNNGAMVALQTMRQINRGMETVQDQISTGLKVGSAKDNAATWAISKVMESDVAGFRAIKENLALGSSTVNVARNAAETTTKLLTEIKEKVVQAQEENVDREKIQADIAQLRDQIASVTGTAQFNGLNLVDNSRTETVLSSLDRSGGGVTASRISVSAQDLTMRDHVFGNGDARDGMAELVGLGDDLEEADDGTAGFDNEIDAGATEDGQASLTFRMGDTVERVVVDVYDGDDEEVIAGRFRAAIADSAALAEMGIRVEGEDEEVNIRLSGPARLNGVSFESDFGNTGAAFDDADGEIDADFATLSLDSGTVRAGDSFRVEYGGETFEYVASDSDRRGDVIAGLATAINSSSAFTARVSENGENVEIVSNGLDEIEAADAGDDFTESTEGIAAGGLNALATLDVANFSQLRGGDDGDTPFADLTDAEQRAVISNSLEQSMLAVEEMIQTSIDSAASFGQAQKRIEIQEDFVANLMDSLRSGIGALVDADMEETSARLQALQVQQQLGIQSLTIANQQPQNILSLFR